MVPADRPCDALERRAREQARIERVSEVRLEGWNREDEAPRLRGERGRGASPSARDRAGARDVHRGEVGREAEPQSELEVPVVHEGVRVVELGNVHAQPAVDLRPRVVRRAADHDVLRQHVRVAAVPAPVREVEPAVAAEAPVAVGPEARLLGVLAEVVLEVDRRAGRSRCVREADGRFELLEEPAEVEAEPLVHPALMLVVVGARLRERGSGSGGGHHGHEESREAPESVHVSPLENNINPVPKKKGHSPEGKRLLAPLPATGQTPSTGRPVPCRARETSARSAVRRTRRSALATLRRSRSKGSR